MIHARKINECGLVLVGTGFLQIVLFSDVFTYNKYGLWLIIFIFPTVLVTVSIILSVYFTFRICTTGPILMRILQSIALSIGSAILTFVCALYIIGPENRGPGP